VEENASRPYLDANGYAACLGSWNGPLTHTDEKEGHRKVALFPFYQAALFVVMACLSILYAEMFDRIQWNGYITPLWLNEGVAKRAERGRKRLQCSGVPLLPEL
jgi:hypothetical protein